MCDILSQVGFDCSFAASKPYEMAGKCGRPTMPPAKNEESKRYRPSIHFSIVVIPTNIAPVPISSVRVSKKMEAGVMDIKRLCATRSLLLLLALAGCASGAPVTNTSQPGAGSNVMSRPVRAIITFRKPATDNTRLAAVIADACHCAPIFVRPFLGHALIYQITLPPDQPFAVFEKAMLSGGAALGVVGVEQDSVEHF